MNERTRRRIADGLERTGLLGAAERVRGAWHRARDRAPGEEGPDGLPLPPAHLRLLVDGRNNDVATFIGVGAEMATAIRDATAQAGSPIEAMDAILDFGCGCGRVARHWAPLEGPQVHGSDYNPQLAAWCGENLPFVRVGVNDLAPPTGYDPGSFDLVYALSVLSHLPADLGQAWVTELRRILRPGGLLIVSVLGDSVRDRLSATERRRYERGELVVERPRRAGRNSCTAYHPPAYVHDRLLAGFEAVRGFPLGPPEWGARQEAYVARRPVI
jgi:SAM-dependent methyltransferase